MKTITIEELLQLESRIQSQCWTSVLQMHIPEALYRELGQHPACRSRRTYGRTSERKSRCMYYAIPVNGVSMLFMNWKQQDMMRRILKADIVPFEKEKEFVR